MNTRLNLLLMLSISAVLIQNAYSQQYNNWYFGTNAAISFNSGTPVALSGSQMIQVEGVASISDSSGKLLFYTDGYNVWNKLNTIMPNGMGLNGSNSSTQSAMIVPVPGSKKLFHVFTTPGGGTPIYYSQVDMSLDSGRGDINNVKNNIVQNASGERLAIAYCTNRTDYWLVGHDLNDTFFAWKITASGIDSIPVKSKCGAAGESIGYMKISPDGRLLAQANYQFFTAEVFNFDNQNGKVSNARTITGITKAYGIEFSSDSRKLFVTGCEVVPATIWQYDLSITSDSMMTANARLVGGDSNNSIGALQLGPDHKIYVSRINVYYLGCITNPDSLNSTLKYTDTAVNLQGGYCQYGLPVMLNPPLPKTALYEGAPQIHELKIYPNPAEDKVFIELDNAMMNESSLITISDISGRIILKKVHSNELKIEISTAEIPAGLYFISMQLDGVNILKKFIIL